MNDTWLKRTAWIMTVYVVIVSVISAVWLFSAADYTRMNWLEVQVRSIVGIGAPVLGLVIIRQQPRHRIGWLWLVIGVLASFRPLGHAVYYGSGSQATGYSPLELFLLWSSEAANLVVLVCQALLLLWFPNGQLASRRWRILYYPLLTSAAILSLGAFVSGPNWNGGVTAGGIVIENPYGWLPEDVLTSLGFSAFLGLVISTLLAAVSLIFRYRSARRLVRYQIRWFVLGAVLFVAMNFGPVLTTPDTTEVLTPGSRLLYIIAFANSIPLYVAVGFAILRYRLFDIDVIIRRTLQYTLLTGLLALVYFGSVVVGQGLVEDLAGAQSPVVIVVSTLAIAALFNPLRIRIQDFIDRRFFRKKYDAEKALAQFAAAARDEVDMDKLTAALLEVVDDTMQSESLSLWLKQEGSKRS